jgi:hypothetical protein
MLQLPAGIFYDQLRARDKVSLEIFWLGGRMLETAPACLIPMFAGSRERSGPPSSADTVRANCRGS